MATKLAPIEYDKYYHMYNRGINSCNIFEHKVDYEHFLKLYTKYIDPIANTYGWCLMPNHFHFLIRIKDENEIGCYKSLNSNGSNDSVRFKIIHNLSEFEEPESVKKPDPTKHLSHLFNAYAKYFNNKYNRHGSLFEKPFRRKLIAYENYLKYLVYYIHHNPAHHGFTEDISKYQWSSFQSILSSKQTKLMQEEVIELFDDLNNLKKFHKQQHELSQLKDVLIDD
jgi:REP element-mobilizing transposase RayT